MTEILFSIPSFNSTLVCISIPFSIYLSIYHLGYICNPRSLKEGMETSRRMTDEIGISLERNLTLECNYMSQWTLACGNSHPAAADHSMSIRGSRCTALIPAFAEEPSWWPDSSAVVEQLSDVTSPFPPSGNQGYIRKPRRSLSVGHYESRRMTDEIGISTKAPQELPCVGLLILPVSQIIGPRSTQRRSTTAVPRATQSVGLE